MQISGIQSATEDSVHAIDGITKTIGEITIVDAGQVPIPFEIEYDPEAIDERFTYAIQAKIYERGELRFVRSEERRVGKEGRSRWSPYH